MSRLDELLPVAPLRGGFGSKVINEAVKTGDRFVSCHEHEADRWDITITGVLGVDEHGNTQVLDHGQKRGGDRFVIDGVSTVEGILGMLERGIWRRRVEGVDP